MISSKLYKRGIRRIDIEKISRRSSFLSFHSSFFSTRKSSSPILFDFKYSIAATSCKYFHTSSFIQKKSNDSSDGKIFPPSILKDYSILAEIPLEDVRNFSIIAHIDHGKSSLSSRVLELTGNLGPEQQWTALEHANLDSQFTNPNSLSAKGNEELAKKEQIELLDTLSVEKERGITVKASAATMLYKHKSAKGKHGLLLLNMVDTPGHVDFGTEVSRSLSCVQGTVLLFDAAQGPQAQSLSVFEKAKRLENVQSIIPVLTKIDLPSAKPIDVALSVSDLFGFDPDEILETSARSRIGISDLLEKVCNDIPPPMQLADDTNDENAVLRAQVVDSWFEPLRGVVCLVQILSGTMEEGSRISIIEPYARQNDDSEHVHNYNAKEHFSVQDVGLVLPQRFRTKSLGRGQLGYVITGLRDPRQARPGTIITMQKDLNKVVQMDLPKTAFNNTEEKSVLYASVHPLEGEGFDELAAAVDKLALNDTGLEVQKTSGNSNNDGGPFLGPGLRVGFQGLLHVEVFQQRLTDEHGIDAIVTPPKVPYKIKYLESRTHKRPADAPEEETIEDLAKWPIQGMRFKVQEPVVDVRIMAPMDYAGNIMELMKRKRGIGMSSRPIDENIWLYTATVPWGGKSFVKYNIQTLYVKHIN